MKQMGVFLRSWTRTCAIAASVSLTGCNKPSQVSQGTPTTTGQRAGEQQAGTFKPTKIVHSSKPPIVTLDEYKQLKTGLSYAMAVKIIGAPGRKSLRRWPKSPRKVMYLWNNPDNSNFNAVFDRDKLVEKSQFGLR